MHDQPTRGSSDDDPATLDDRLQMAVLTHLLLAYPVPFTLDEIVAAFTEPFEPPSFIQGDNVRRAVRDLVCAGVLREHGGCVLPTSATRRVWELAEG
jgi:hypothetical protein